jgi:uncharacterized protein YndB with AHSA1/START domain
MTATSETETTMEPGQYAKFTLIGEREIQMSRVFDAPREVVFRAWTEADALKRWWGPQGHTMTHCTVDLRPGGAWHYCFRSEEGQESWGKATYREIVAPKRLVYADVFSDAEGNELSEPMVMTFTFEDADGKTLLTGRTLFTSTEHRDQILSFGVEQGMNSTLDCLDEYLATVEGRSA